MKRPSSSTALNRQITSTHQQLESRQAASEKGQEARGGTIEKG